MRVVVQHRNRYHYPRPALLGPQLIRLRPAPRLTVAREIQGIATEAIALLHGYPAQVRQMIRKLLDGGRLRCEPVVRRGHFQTPRARD